MVLPIIGYGSNLLRHECEDVAPDYPKLDELISNMWETMYNANGCGLAAAQVGKQINLFIVDSKTTFENSEAIDKSRDFEPDDTGILQTFLNAKIIDRSERLWAGEEGCLSIPGVNGSVKRNWSITLEYMNESFQKAVHSFSGKTAQMIQHEYDHTQGILYLDYLAPLKRQVLKNQLKKIVKGHIQPNYPMQFGFE